MENITSKAPVFLGMMRRIEHWRPMRNVPRSMKRDVLAIRKFHGVRHGLLSIDEKLVDDLVVSAGLNALCGQAFDGSGARPAVFGYCAIGTDGTAPAAGNTALGSEKMRVAAVYSKDAGVGACSVDATFTIDASYALAECALFNAAAVGTMFCRDTYTVKNVVLNDTVKIYYTPTFSTA